MNDGRPLQELQKNFKSVQGAIALSSSSTFSSVSQVDIFPVQDGQFVVDQSRTYLHDRGRTYSPTVA